MSEQEKIQAYIRGWLKYIQGTYDDESIDCALKQLTLGLDLQGVVIKVDIPIQIKIEGLEARQVIQTKLPVNVTAVEPLIEVKHDTTES